MVDRFDDVAVLSSGVAFSGRKTADKKGYMFFFLAPAMGSSIFPNYPDYLNFSGFFSGRILLDAGPGDDFAYVSQTASGTDEVGFLNWNNLMQRYGVGSVPNGYHAFDLSYGQVVNIAELLMGYQNMYAKEIYTAGFTSSVVPPLFYFPGHFFPYEQMHSLDAVGGSGSLFVAAEVGAYDGNLAIYRYNRNNWPEQVCTEYVSLPIIYLAFKVLDDKQKFESRGFNIEAIGEECQKTTIPVVTKCHENRAGQ